MVPAPGLGAVIFLTLFMAGVFSIGFFLVWRVMNRPDSTIGSHLPREDEDEHSDDADGRSRNGGSAPSTDDPPSPGPDVPPLGPGAVDGSDWPDFPPDFPQQNGGPHSSGA